jgi:hypothetical protein
VDCSNTQDNATARFDQPANAQRTEREVETAVFDQLTATFDQLGVSTPAVNEGDAQLDLWRELLSGM